MEKQQPIILILNLKNLLAQVGEKLNRAGNEKSAGFCGL